MRLRQLGLVDLGLNPGDNLTLRNRGIEIGEKLLDLAGDLRADARVARVLLDLAKHLGKNAASGRIIIGHKLSQADLAAMAGVARENVNRVLRQWKRQKIVTQLSSFYSLNDCAALERELKSYRREHVFFKRKTLGLTVPPSQLVARADEVIE